MQTLYLYFLKELFLNTLSFFISFSLLLTLLMGTFNLRELFELNPSLLTIFKVYLFTFGQIIPFVLPLSSFMAELFTLQRQKEEKELLALFSLGYTLKDLFKPLLFYIFIIFFLTFLSQFYFSPLSKRALKEEQMALAQRSLSLEIQPKRPYPLGKTLYLYVGESEKKDSQTFLKRVILLEKSEQGEKRGLYLAKEGTFDLKNGTFHLTEGYLFLQEGLKNFEILNFKEYFFQLHPEALKKEDLYFKRGELTFKELKKALKELKPGTEKYFRYLSEYYQRLFYGLSVISFLLQGLFLSLFLKPYSRFLLFLSGLLFYLLFYALYSFFISLGESGKLNPLLSHLLFNALFGGLILLQAYSLKKRGVVL